MVKMGMGEHDMVDARHVFKAQLAGTGAGVNQYGVIQAVAGGAPPRAANAAAAAKQAQGNHIRLAVNFIAARSVNFHARHHSASRAT